jgi:hypothetical protein
MTTIEMPVTDEVLLFQYPEAATKEQRCVIRHINVVFAGVGLMPADVGLVGSLGGEAVRDVKVWLGGMHAQHDEHINIQFLAPRKRKQWWIRNLVPDGLVATTIELSGKIAFDSRNNFPIYRSLEIARAAQAAVHELVLRRIRGEITVEQRIEAFRKLVERANGAV